MHGVLARGGSVAHRHGRECPWRWHFWRWVGRLRGGGVGAWAARSAKQVTEALWERRGGVGRCMGGSVGGAAGRIGTDDGARGDGTFGAPAVGYRADE